MENLSRLLVLGALFLREYVDSIITVVVHKVINSLPRTELTCWQKLLTDEVPSLTTYFILLYLKQPGNVTSPRIF